MLFLLLSVGQTQHPCDVLPPSSAIVVTGTTYEVQFCALVADMPEAFTVYTNGVASDLRPLTQSGAPNAAGRALYIGPKEMRFARGTYILHVTVWNNSNTGIAQESPLSNPLTLSAVDSLPRPTAPVLMGVVK
jgi:hypothetical protein